MKKKNIEKQIETFVYGILSLMFGMAFFFGVLYPEYGVSPQSYRVVESDRYREETRELQEGQEIFNVTLREQMEHREPSRIQYKSYFYERLKNR